MSLVLRIVHTQYIMQHHEQPVLFNLYFDYSILDRHIFTIVSFLFLKMYCTFMFCCLFKAVFPMESLPLSDIMSSLVTFS